MVEYIDCMEKKIVKIVAVSLCFALNATSISTAQAKSGPSLLPDDPAKLQQFLGQEIKEKIERGTYFILGIESKLKRNSDELQLLKDNAKALEKKVHDSRKEVTTLQQQVENINTLIGDMLAKIEATKIQIAAHENAVVATGQDIKNQEALLAGQASSLSVTLTAYYLQNHKFFELEGNNPLLLAFLASDESTGEILKKSEYLVFLKNATQDLSREIMKHKDSLGLKKASLEKSTRTLNDLRVVLASEVRTLNDAQAARTEVLAEAKGRKVIYETLLEFTQKEEEQVSTQMERLKENYSFFQTKLAELKNNPAAKNINFNVTAGSVGTVLAGKEPLAWPVPPNSGISAFFHDESYKKALGVQHNAVDIRITHGSKVVAAADGIVTKVADNGMAYSYIIIAHPDNLVTLYGHMSEMMVNDGELVRQGQIIGLSGGTPGTKGAGWLTTGAHLHFEVFKNFQHVDPLDYLPLAFVPVASLPEKYLERLTGDRAAPTLK